MSQGSGGSPVNFLDPATCEAILDGLRDTDGTCPTSVRPAHLPRRCLARRPPMTATHRRGPRTPVTRRLTPLLMSPMRPLKCPADPASGHRPHRLPPSSFPLRISPLRTISVLVVATLSVRQRAPPTTRHSRKRPAPAPTIAGRRPTSQPHQSTALYSWPRSW